jgi:nicotinamidase-related amidase
MSDDPDKTALLIVDMITKYDFEDGETLAANARNAVPHIARLIERAGEARDVSVIYVNDNYGKWRSSLQDLVDDVMQSVHAELLEPILPGDDARFVLKPRHTVFYETPLEYLLRQEGVGRIVLTGQVTEQCIVYSALDAYVRHIPAIVPTDAVAHIHQDLAGAALKMMEVNMRVDVCRTDDCRL